MCRGCTGIYSGSASAVSIGTANFFNPYAAEENVQGIEAYMREKKVDRLTDLIGIVK